MFRILMIIVMGSLLVSTAAFGIESHNSGRSNTSNAALVDSCTADGGVMIERNGQSVCGMLVDGESLTFDDCRNARKDIINYDDARYCVPGTPQRRSR